MLVSFIVPVFRTEDWLRSCIDSILLQSEKEWELILIDDGSDDMCPEICDEYAEKDGRIKVIHNENRGVVYSRNEGIDTACGEYVCFVDSDDTVSPLFVKKIMDTLSDTKEKPDIMVFNYISVFSDHREENILRIKEGFYDRKRMEDEILPYYISDRRKGSAWWTPGIPVYLWGKAFRREYVKQHLFTDESITLSEDAAMVFECIFYAGSMTVSHDAVYYYERSNLNSVSRVYRKDLVDMFSRLFAGMLSKIGGRDPGTDIQLNDYFTYRILRAVNIEAEHEKNSAEAARRLAEGFKRTGISDLVHIKGLTFSAGIFVFLIKSGQFRLIMFLLKHYNRVKYKTSLAKTGFSDVGQRKGRSVL